MVEKDASVPENVEQLNKIIAKDLEFKSIQEEVKSIIKTQPHPFLLKKYPLKKPK